MKQRFIRHPLFVIFFTVFVDLLGFGILLPVIPYLLADPSSKYSLLSKGMTVQDGYILLGYLAGAFPLAQFIASPLLGQLSDVFGRRKILLFSLIGKFFSYVLFAIGIVTRNFPLMFAARFLDGFTGGNISVAQAVIADTSTEHTRTKNFGLIGAAFGLGFILGPYLGGKLSDPSVLPWFNITTPFLFAPILCLFNIVFILMFLPETLQHKKKEISLTWTSSLKNISNAFAQKGKRELYITVLLFQSGIAFFTTFISVYLIERFAMQQGSVGEFFAYAGLWIAFTQVVITRFLTGVSREKHILQTSLIGTGICILLFFAPTHAWQLLFIVPFFSIFMGLSQATITALVSGSTDQFSQGESLGISTSMQALANTVPPVLSGYIAAATHPNIPLYVAGAVVLLSSVVFFTSNRSKVARTQNLL